MNMIKNHQRKLRCKTIFLERAIDFFYIVANPIIANLVIENKIFSIKMQLILEETILERVIVRENRRRSKIWKNYLWCFFAILICLCILTITVCLTFNTFFAKKSIKNQSNATSTPPTSKPGPAQHSTPTPLPSLTTKPPKRKSTKKPPKLSTTQNPDEIWNPIDSKVSSFFRFISYKSALYRC